jgi:hypothetical protein
LFDPPLFSIFLEILLQATNSFFCAEGKERKSHKVAQNNNFAQERVFIFLETKMGAAMWPKIML